VYMPGIDLKGETEESLVAAIRNRKQKALSCLYDAYAPVLLGVISRIVQDNLVAEEVLKDTFTAIWSRIAVYDSTKTRFLSWSLALARGIALEAVKTGKYQALADGQLNTTFVSEEEKELKNAFKERERVKEVFNKLEEKEKVILDLIYLKGRSCSEAATELGITEDTLKISLKNAFTHLVVQNTA